MSEISEQCSDNSVELDERRAPRRRVLQGARILLGDKLGEVSCVVRDISLVGCRLETSIPMALPKAFRLVFNRDQRVVSCLTVWRSGAAVGVAFVED